MALRKPQEESLEFFARLCDILSMRKNPTTDQQIIEDYADEYNAQPTWEKKEKFLRVKAAEIAADFYKEIGRAHV